MKTLQKSHPELVLGSKNSHRVILSLFGIKFKFNSFGVIDLMDFHLEDVKKKYHSELFSVSKLLNYHFELISESKKHHIVSS